MPASAADRRGLRRCHHPDAVEVEYPTLLAFPAAKLRAYPKESVVAEKFEASVKLGMANSP
jgi:hypothetical protein